MHDFTPPASPPSARRPAAPRHLGMKCLALLLPALLAACGDGYGDGGGGGPLSCSVADQEAWLQAYFNDQYYFYAHSPQNPPQTAAVADYFDSLLYTGGDPRFPANVADIWSNITPSDKFNRFFGNGQDLGYGVFVNGIEVQGHPELPLVVRYVDPNSPAASQGIARGDQITAINGVPAATVITSGDYSALVASSAGQTLALDTHNVGGDHHYSLLSTTYTLSPVNNTQVITSPGGRKIGYVLVKDMIDSAVSPYDAAFAQFKSAGVQDVVIDLRYNGGGLVGVGEILASYPAANLTNNQVYTNLTFNDKNQFQNVYYTFDPFAAALALPRVYVLTGPRTCSAAEQVVSGLSPYVSVVTIGSASCGKPFGFTPQDACGSVFSAVTFQATNSAGTSIPFGGITPTCAVAEDLGKPLGALDEPLLAAAAVHADSGACPVVGGAATRAPAAAPGTLRAQWMEPNERQGMYRN